MTTPTRFWSVHIPMFRFTIDGIQYTVTDTVLQPTETHQ